MMGLKLTLDAAPSDDIKPFYKEQDGKWILDMDDQVVPASKLTEVETKLGEFRNNNITLKQQLEAATKTSLKDKRPDEIDVNAILETHVSEMKQNYETKLSELTEESTKLKGHLEKVVLSDSVKTVATEYGVHPSALPDVLNRAKEMFVVVDGQAVPRDKKLDKEGKQYTIQTWLTSLTESAPHLFSPSRGSGSQRPVKGAAPVGEVTGINRIAQGLRNLSK